MSTRSFVGTVTNDGKIRARYVHSDGYPTGMGPALAALIERDGLKVALTTIAGHPGWSGLAADNPDIFAVEPDPDAPFDSAAYRSSLFAKGGAYAKGYVSVPGYGVAYDIPHDGEWTEGHLDRTSGATRELDDTWAQWGYLFDLQHSLLYVLTVGGLTDAVTGTVVATIPLAEISGQDWTLVECGEDFERCGHYARVHDDSVPEESQLLPMAAWLGVRPLDPSDATGVTVDGKRYSINGNSGCCGSWVKGPVIPPRLHPTVWYSSARDADGQPCQVMTRLMDGTAAPGVTLHYPPTKAEAMASA